MSGSGGNSFLDFLRLLAPAGVPAWALALAAALATAAVGWVFLRLEALASARMERGAAAVRPSAAPTLALAAALGALAVFPFAPHVFFADVELGLFLVLALGFAAAIGDPRTAGWRIPLALALLAPVATFGTLDLIEASRLQSRWLGMGWFVFVNPFGLPGLFVFALAALEVTKREEAVSTFLLSAVAAVFFLGGFESPATALLRRSLGEDPGFLNHATQPDGSMQTRLAIGGLVFQLVCAATLIAKTLLVMFVLMRLRLAPRRRLWERAAALPWIQWASVALCCVLGAGLWEWARAALWSST